MNRNSAYMKNWTWSKWLLFTIFSLQTVLLQGWTSQNAILVDAVTYTEWIIDQRFHSESTTFSLWVNKPLRNNGSSFSAFQSFSFLLSLNVVIAVKLNHAETLIHQFPSSIYYLQRSIYFFSLDSLT